MQTTTCSAREKPRILCIDDDPVLTDALMRRLEDWGFEPSAANYGTQGITSAVAATPDLIITDLRMPQGAGDYVVERLHENAATREIPIIVLTGCRDADLEMRLRGLGITAFFRKPVACELLQAAIREALGGTLPSPCPSTACV